MEKKDGVEINLADIYYYLKKRLLIIVVVTLLSCILGMLITVFFIPKKYTASTRIYVLNQQSDSIVYSDFQLSDKLLSDYKVLITGRNVTNRVIQELGLNMTHSQLAAAISVTAPDETRVVQISVTHVNPYMAAEIANAVCETASEQIQVIMAVDAVKLVYGAEVPTVASSPSLKLNTVLSAAVGLILSVGVLVLIYVLDDAIRTEEDVERYLGLSTLGVIPISSELGNKNKENKVSRLFKRKKKKGAKRGEKSGS